VQAELTLATKLAAVFSHLSATRLNRFSLPIACSILARALHKTFGKNFGLSLTLARYGITSTIPRSRQATRFAFESYRLSVSAARGWMSGPIPSEHINCVLSLTSPLVRWKEIGRPLRSVVRWILHENPTLDRPERPAVQAASWNRPAMKLR
jgi:hypothetical protein